MSTLVIATITDGAKALLWLYIWLASSMAASYLSERKGFGDRAGLATGLLLTFLGPLIWLLVPAKPESKWANLGPFGRGQKRRTN